MSVLASGTFATAIGLGLEVGRDHRRGSRRRDDRWRLGRRFGELLSQTEQCEDDGLFSLAVDLPSLLLGERRSQGNRGRGGAVVTVMAQKDKAKTMTNRSVP